MSALQHLIQEAEARWEPDSVEQMFGMPRFQKPLRLSDEVDAIYEAIMLVLEPLQEAPESKALTKEARRLLKLAMAGIQEILERS